MAKAKMTTEDLLGVFEGPPRAVLEVRPGDLRPVADVGDHSQTGVTTLRTPLPWV